MSISNTIRTEANVLKNKAPYLCAGVQHINTHSTREYHTNSTYVASTYSNVSSSYSSTSSKFALVQPQAYSDSSLIFEDQTKSKVLVVAGATGQMGSELIKEAAKNTDYKIVGFTRNPETLPQSERVKFVKTPKDINDSSAWKDALLPECEHADEILSVNMIGTSTSRGDRTLNDMIEKPALALAKGVKKVANTLNLEDRTHFVNMSSIAALYIPENEYGNARDQADRKVLNEIDVKNVIALRPSLVFNDPIVGEDGTQFIDMGHSYSPEQWANLPFQCVIGSGNQKIQPVYLGDVNSAILNVPEKKLGKKIINAVGSDIKTQKEMVEYFPKLIGKRPRIVKIPYGMAMPLAQKFPEGRFAPYAVEMFKKLEKMDVEVCHLEFRNLVGNPLKAFEDIYRKGTKIVIATAPIKQHLINAVKTIKRK